MKKSLFILFLTGLFSSSVFSSSVHLQNLTEGSIVVQFYQDRYLGKKAPEQFIIFQMNNGRYEKAKTIDQVSCGESCWQNSALKTSGINAAINSDDVLNIISLENSRSHKTSSYVMSKPKLRVRNSNNFDPDANLSFKISIVKECPDRTRQLLEIYDVDGHMVGTTKGKFSLFVQETYRLPHNIDSTADKELYSNLIQEIISTTKASLKSSFPGRNERAYRLNVN